jgi:outer membrane protein assembly factor BamB
MIELPNILCPSSPPLAVVPVLIAPLWALVYIIPAVAIALFGALVALLSPRSLLNLAKVLWRLKLHVLVFGVVVTAGVWGLMKVWPARSAEAAGSAARGANDNWPIFRGGLCRLGAAGDAIAPTSGGVNWARFAGEEWFLSSPAVVGNRVYVASAQISAFDSKNGTGRIYCLDANTGKVAWAAGPEFKTGHPTYRATFASPVVRGEYLVCGEGLHWAKGARLVCLDVRTGRLRWSLQTVDHVECAPVIADVRVGGRIEARVFVGAGDDGYYCVSLATGEQRWHLDGKKYPDAETSLAVHDGKVYAGLGNDGQALCVLDAADGKELARVRTPYPVFSPPAIDGGKLFVGMGNGDFVDAGSPPKGEVWCVDLNKLQHYTGGDFQPDWKIPLAGTVLGAVAVTEDRVYFGDNSGKLHCAERATGRKIATFDAHAALNASPTVAGNCVYVVSDAGMLYGLDARTLDVTWEYKVGSKPRCISSPAVAHGRLFVGTQDDGFVCLGQPGPAKAAVWAGRLGGAGTGGNPFASPPPSRVDFKWQYPGDQEDKAKNAAVAAPPALLGENLLVGLTGLGGGKAGLACLSTQTEGAKAPKPRWLYPTPHGVWLSPAVAAEAAFCSDGKPGEAGRFLHCLGLRDGRLQWKAALNEDASGAFIAGPDDVLVLDGATGLSGYNSAGRRAWSAELPGKAVHAPAAAGAMVLAATTAPPMLVALDRPTGIQLWQAKLDSPPVASPWAHKNRVYVATAAGLEARSLLDGSPLPSAEWAMQGGGVSGDFVLNESFAAYVSAGGELVVLRRADGKLAMPAVAGARIGTAPLLARGVVLYEAAAGKIMKLALPAGEAAAPATQPAQAAATATVAAPASAPATSQATQPTQPAPATAAATEEAPKPTEWFDASWLGEPATPMILGGAGLYMGRSGWGLVCLGEGK